MFLTTIISTGTIYIGKLSWQCLIIVLLISLIFSSFSSVIKVTALVKYFLSSTIIDSHSCTPSTSFTTLFISSGINLHGTPFGSLDISILLILPSYFTFNLLSLSLYSWNKSPVLNQT